jgi:hypothetical protein
MKKIVSFGDSFIWGTEIPGNRNGELAWPALVAKNLKVDYITCSVPGCGNENIAQQIYSYFATNSHKDVLAVINWTWALRWDFYIVNSESWVTLGPTCVPVKLENHVGITEADRLISLYKDYAGNSTVWDRWRSLQAMCAAQSFLQQRGIVNVQTYMDKTLFVKDWHAPGYIATLQDLVIQHLESWNGMNFLEWCEHNGHEITKDTWHPLMSAHQDAAEFWGERYNKLLKET